MTTSNTPRAKDVWTTIDRERRRDRVVRWISVSAWGLTFLILLIFAGITASKISIVERQVMVGASAQQAIYEAWLPLIAVVGVLSVLIATLSTVGIFLRMRTASLVEIQLRLAALERMLAEQPDSDSD